ncbi:hypothetical protein FOA52_004504, partial [Chlamydomonas sp. UWO 241]
MAEVTRRFVSVGVNRVVNALDWGDDGRLAYGGHHMVVVYDPEAAEVESTMVGHSGMVNCVLCIPGSVTSQAGHAARLIASGAADCCVRVWAVEPAGSGRPEPWRCVAVLKGHTAPVTALACYSLSGEGVPHGAFLLISTAGDRSVHVWRCKPRPAAASATYAEGSRGSALDTADAAHGQAAWDLAQRVATGTHIQQAVALTHIPGDPTTLLLATGGTDKAVHLYVRAPGRDSHFELACSLAGHENWVRSLAFCHATIVNSGGRGADSAAASSQLLLASACQDRYARVWSIVAEGGEAVPSAAAPATATAAETTANADAANNAAGASGAPGGAGTGAGTGAYGTTGDGSGADEIARYAPKLIFPVGGGRTLRASLEALLIGHEDWVHSVRWRPAAGAAVVEPGSSVAEAGRAGGGGLHVALPRDQLCLLTSSMDRTMMLWQHEQRSGLWMSQASVGDAGAQCLGYFGACFSPTGARVVAHGFTGAMHLWDSSSDADTNTSAGHRAWVPLHAAGGHFGPVAGCCWAADGRCVLSVGEDQTARVWTRVRAHWCEVARPQVHGHDFTCVASVPKADEDGAASAQYAFISGSEEKMLRAFEAPQVFVDTLDMARCRAPGGGGRQAVSGRAFGAAIPALGLSNKAVFDGGDDGDDGEGASNAGVGSGMAGGHYNDGPDFAPCAAPASSEGPPLEEHLSQNTLWPEVHKLYGHGSDVYCLAV